MDDKYFVPEISDLRIGYEYEYNGHFTHLPPQEWKKIIVDYDFFTKNEGWDEEPISMYYLSDLIQHPKNFRVPYLTKEQIEAEGWEKIYDEEYIKELPTKEGEASQTWWFNNNSTNEYQSTFEFRYRGYYNIKFQGEIKSLY
jgi:hypothetical protein